MSEKFEFKVGDVVNYLPMGDEEYVLEDNPYELDFPLYIKNIGSFAIDGKYRTNHKLPSLKLVRRPMQLMVSTELITSYHL